MPRPQQRQLEERWVFFHIWKLTLAVSNLHQETEKRSKHHALSVQSLATNLMCVCVGRGGGRQGRSRHCAFLIKSNKGTVCWHSARLPSTSCTGFVWKRLVVVAEQWPKTYGRFTKQWLLDKNVHVLAWSPYSSDLVVAFSSLARILGEGSTIRSPPALFLIF